MNSIHSETLISWEWCSVSCDHLISRRGHSDIWFHNFWCYPNQPCTHPTLLFVTKHSLHCLKKEWCRGWHWDWQFILISDHASVSLGYSEKPVYWVSLNKKPEKHFFLICMSSCLKLQIIWFLECREARWLLLISSGGADFAGQHFKTQQTKSLLHWGYSWGKEASA